MFLRKHYKYFITSIISICILTGCNAANTKDTPSTQAIPSTVVSNISNSEPDLLNTLASTEATSAASNNTVTPIETTEPVAPPVEIRLMMVGDMLAHEGVYKSGRNEDGTYNYDHLFTHIKDDIDAADIAILNQEVVLAGTEMGLSGYPMFNSPSELGDGIADAGFNVILHATNHALDRGAAGLDKTMEFWATKHPDIAVLGVHGTLDDYENNNVYIYEQEGVRIAILNYTYGTNGIPLPSGREYMVSLLDEEKVAKDMAYARENSDFIIVCPHWGVEYVFKPVEDQIYWAKYFIDLGANLIIGTHPHVVEPVQWVQSDLGKFGLVYYSLGNFVSNQDTTATMLGAMAKVTIKKKNDLVYISNYSMEPLVTHKVFGHRLITTYHLEDYTDELASANMINYDVRGFSLDALNNIWEQFK